MREIVLQMKRKVCPKCGAPLPGIWLLASHKGIYSCRQCGARLKTRGVVTYLLLASFIAFFIPFSWFPKDLYLFVPLALMAILFAFYLAYLIAIRVEEDRIKG